MQVYNMKRNRLEVLTEILYLCKSPLAKTRLMQKANLSYTTLQDCLQQLQELDIVRIHADTSEFVTTEKGILFLIKWRQLQEFLTPQERITMKTKKVQTL
jgi:predicted transcriptional regulator